MTIIIITQIVATHHARTSIAEALLAKTALLDGPLENRELKMVGQNIEDRRKKTKPLNPETTTTIPTSERKMEKKEKEKRRERGIAETPLIRKWLRR